MSSDAVREMTIMKRAEDGEPIPFLIEQIENRADAPAAYSLAEWLKFNQSFPGVNRVDIRSCIARLARVALERGEVKWMTYFAIDFAYLPDDVREGLYYRICRSGQARWIRMLEGRLQRRLTPVV